MGALPTKESRCGYQRSWAETGGIRGALVKSGCTVIPKKERARLRGDPGNLPLIRKGSKVGSLEVKF